MQKNPHTSSHSLTVLAYRRLLFFGGVWLALACLFSNPALAQTTNYTLGTTNLLVGPASGSNSVVLGVSPLDASWTATANDTWLHLSAANQNGTGSKNVIFGYDENPGLTRVGTLSIAGQTVTVTQAGSTYVAAGALTALVSEGLSLPVGVAVDGAGNVYLTDTGHNAIKEWTLTNNAVRTVVSSGLDAPQDVAVDAAGNLYIAEEFTNAILEWTMSEAKLSTLTTLESSLNGVWGLALDAAGNIYIAANTIQEWNAASKSVNVLLSTGATAVAVDAAGNIYIASDMVFEWNSNKSLVLASNVLGPGGVAPGGVAADGSGNVYFSESGAFTNAVMEWSAAAQSVSAVIPSSALGPSSELDYPERLVVDSAGNLYIADQGNNAIKELPRAFVDPTTKFESLAAGTDSLPPVLPVTANLLPPFAPFTDQLWLTITGITNGVVSFAFTASTTNRTATITVLGQSIIIDQGGPAYALGTYALVEGPSAGFDSVVLAVQPPISPWTNQANASWLHLSQANQNGTGSTNVIFSFDANPGGTRTGTLIIAGHTLTVTQAGSTYVPVDILTLLVSSVAGPVHGPVVDAAGNVYFVGGTNTIYEWAPSNNTVNTVITLDESNFCTAITVDGAGDIYVASGGVGGSLCEWTAADHNLRQLISLPEEELAYELALDCVGNVYTAHTGSGLVKWTAADDALSPIVLGGPQGVALDRADNIYYAGLESDTNFYERIAANNATIQINLPGVITIGSDNLAVDGSGNVYFSGFGPVMKWTAANGHYTEVAPAEDEQGVVDVMNATVDGAGNIYCLIGNSIAELPHALVDPTPKVKGLAGGSDSLPPVVPATANLLPPFAPTSDQEWLTITGVTNGVVSFAFTANAGPARIANITLLGQTIPVTQGTIGTPAIITGARLLNSNLLQFSFTNAPSASWTVLCSTNLLLPLSEWAAVGTVSNVGSGQFQFTTQLETNDSQLFYMVRSP